jgi:hypothetical protein
VLYRLETTTQSVWRSRSSTRHHEGRQRLPAKSMRHGLTLHYVPLGRPTTTSLRPRYPRSPNRQTFLPRGPHFRNCDIRIWPTFLGNGTEVLSEILKHRTAEEQIVVIDLVYDEARFQDDDTRNHRIVGRIGVFGDVKILLNVSPCIRAYLRYLPYCAVFRLASCCISAVRKSRLVGRKQRLNHWMSRLASAGRRSPLKGLQDSWMLSKDAL